MFMYLNILNNTLAAGGTLDDLRNGSSLSLNATGTYNGYLGSIVIDSNGTWNPTFSVWGLDATDTPTIFVTVQTISIFNDHAVWS
jgi:hypothetical protein